MNDCADAVDIEEVRDDERDDTLIFDNHAACVFYVAQRVLKMMFRSGSMPCFC